MIPREDLETIAREIGSGLAKGPQVLLIIGLICLALGLCVMGMRAVELLLVGKFAIHEMLRLMVPLSGTWFGPLILWLGACAVRSRKTMRIMLVHRRCPHCGYDLRGLPVDASDGATVCPECGCAWRLDSREPSRATADDDSDGTP